MPLCRSFMLLGAALLPLLSGVAQAYTSATAFASANEYSLLCSTCSIDFQDLGSDADGGPGATEPRSWKSIEQVPQRRLYSFAEADAVADV